MPIVVTCDWCGAPEAYNYPAGSGPPYLCSKCHAKKNKPYADRQRLHSLVEKTGVYRQHCRPQREAQEALRKARADLKRAELLEAEAYRRDDSEAYDRMLYQHNAKHVEKSDAACLACKALCELGLRLDAGTRPPV